YDIQLVKDVKKNRQYHILLFPKTETDTLTNDAEFGLIVDMDSYLNSAAKFYMRYSSICQVLEPLDLRVAEGSITTEEARAIIERALDTEPTFARLFHDGIRDAVNGDSNERAILRIALALMDGDIMHGIFIFQKSADIRFSKDSLLQCAQLLRLAYGSTLLELAQLYDSVFNQAGEEDEPGDEANIGVLGRLQIKGIIRLDMALQTTDAAEIRIACREILDEELLPPDVVAKSIQFGLKLDDLGIEV
ncbi:hypothetical protein HY570_02400, partial [Candidatus Micrarchaeota archaeon]|nr:hypothetical protein [Candidatus Micrarchaeota archaeon]